MMQRKVSLHLASMAAWLTVLTAASYGGTLQNYDSEEYRIETRTTNGNVAQKIISGNASLPGLCSFDGCELLLVRTGQTLTMGPNDHVVIMNGQMSVRKPLFPNR